MIFRTCSRTIFGIVGLRSGQTPVSDKSSGKNAASSGPHKESRTAPVRDSQKKAIQIIGASQQSGAVRPGIFTTVGAMFASP